MKGAIWIRVVSPLCLSLVCLTCRADAYELVAADSRVRVLVFSAGPLAKLGHNHVISASEMTGEIQYRPDALQESRFQLQFPVAGLIVDDPQQREAAGPAFSATPDDDAVRATRDNMIGPQVLDSAHYPRIQVQSESVSGTLPELTVRVSMQLHGVRREMVVPVRVRLTDGRLHATGSVSFAQREFGIEPLKILLGAIAVQDEVKVQYDLVAARRPPP